MELRGPLGSDVRFRDLVVTDAHGNFRAVVNNIGGPLAIMLIHEHCDWYGVTTTIEVKEMKEHPEMHVVVTTKRESCPDWLSPFAGQ